MVHPKYSPEEALQRMKLMMEYDSSRTYTENKVIVENKKPLKEEFITAAGLTAAGYWLIAAIGAGTTLAASAAAEYSTAEVDEKIKLALGACDSATGEAAKASMTEPEQAAVVKKFRFTPKQIEALIRIQWWNWDENKICEEINELTGENIEKFILKHDKL